MSHKLNRFFLESWKKSFCSKIIAFRSSQLSFTLEPAFLQPEKKVIDNLLFEVMNILASTTKYFCRQKKTNLAAFLCHFFLSPPLDDKKVYINFLDFTEIENFFDCVFSHLFVMFSLAFLSCFAASWMKNYTYEKFSCNISQENFFFVFVFFVLLGSVKEGTWLLRVGWTRSILKTTHGKCIIQNQTWLANLIWVSDRGSLNI